MIKRKKTIKQDDDKEEMVVSSIADFIENVNDPKVLANKFSHVLIVKITSIDKVTNYNERIKKYVNPCTLGKATVIHAIKGRVVNNNIIFSRLGGTLPFSEWIKADPAPEKIRALKKMVNTKMFQKIN